MHLKDGLHSQSRLVQHPAPSAPCCWQATGFVLQDI